jgi:hypothetical protein
VNSGLILRWVTGCSTVGAGWIWLSSGRLRHIDWQKFTDGSEELTTLITRAMSPVDGRSKHLCRKLPALYSLSREPETSYPCCLFKLRPEFPAAPVLLRTWSCSLVVWCYIICASEAALLNNLRPLICSTRNLGYSIRWIFWAQAMQVNSFIFCLLCSQVWGWTGLAAVITRPAGIRTFNFEFKRSVFEQQPVVDNVRVVSGPAPRLFHFSLSLF